MKTTQQIIDQEVLTEKDINLIIRRANAGEQIPMIEDKAITPEQTEKGLAWLLNQWKTPLGKERTSNPFGYREEEILEDFDHFTLAYIYDAATYFQSQHGIKNFVRVYRVVNRDGDSFQYYGQGGNINIIG